MNGTDANTGKPLKGYRHLLQSVADILSTRKGSRVMRRDYGSDLPLLVDAPLNDETLLDIYAATIGALQQWEPRIRVDSVNATQPQAGQLELTITGTYLPDGQEITLDGVLIQ